jgi:SRSO17 transposase
MTIAEAVETAVPGSIVGWEEGLDSLHRRIARRFRRAEARVRARRYLRGLLAPLERKNGWQLAEHLGEPGPQGVQRLLNSAAWDADAVRDDLRAYVVEALGAPGGLLIVDETGFLKKGTKSVGVQRQYSGTAGRRENCQVGVFLAYASARGCACIDRALYLPEAWAEDRGRRAEAGVPEGVAFATKVELARAMLARAFAAGVPAAWVVGDTVYGGDDLRRWLEGAGRPYALAVACTHGVWTRGRQASAEALAAELPAAAWARLSAGDGSQGPRWYEWACLALPYEARAGMAHWLLVRRSLTDRAERAYYRVYGPDATPVAEMVRAVGGRWAVEVAFEEAKGQVGLDHYAVRRWDAWHRHVTLCLLAHAFLVATRALAAAEAEKGAMPPWSPRPCRRCGGWRWRWPARPRSCPPGCAGRAGGGATRRRRRAATPPGGRAGRRRRPRTPRR